MHAASNSSLFAIVMGAPRATDSAPIVITDMYQVATIRARRTFLDMPRCCRGCRSGAVLNRTVPPIVAPSCASFRAAVRCGDDRPRRMPPEREDACDRLSSAGLLERGCSADRCCSPDSLIVQDDGQE